jgi:hypothetical protein
MMDAPSVPITTEQADALSTFIKDAVYKTLKKQLLHFILTDKSRTLVESVCKLSYPKLVLDTLDKIINELRGELNGFNEHGDSDGALGSGPRSENDHKRQTSGNRELSYERDVDQGWEEGTNR